jgi:hypothetical protein
MRPASSRAARPAVAPIAKPQRGEKKAIREHHKRQADLEKAAAKRAWRASVSGVCAMCHAAKHGSAPVQEVTPEIRQALHNDLVRMEGHHLIAEADLRRMKFPVEVRFDPRLQLTLCVYHHTRHERWVERIPRELYPPSVFAFAAEHGLEWLLEKEMTCS